MIQIYKPTNENYESNGDIVLMPETYTVSAERTSKTRQSSKRRHLTANSYSE